jgi:6-phosphogluconate dehydrogenase
MELGLVGLGRMGFNMALRLLSRGHRVAAWNRSPEKTSALAARGAVGAETLEALAAALTPPRAVWVMVPAGRATEETIGRLAGLLSAGDMVIDGGNSRYTDSVRRAGELAARNLVFLDAGTSGGIRGLENGYCLMVGGPRSGFERIEAVLADLAAPGGYLHVGPSGAGHFVKMIHNGIEYGMLEAYAEGLELLESSGFDLDLAAVCRLWNRGSVVRSWLLELAEEALSRDPGLDGIQGYIDDSGEGRWAVAEALEKAVQA